MKTESFGFTVETAYGKKLDSALDVTASFDKFENFEEIPEKERPDEKEVLNYVNAKAKASARAAATTKALTDAGIQKPDLKTSEELRFSTIVKALVAGGVEDSAARQQANALLGTSY